MTRQMDGKTLVLLRPFQQSHRGQKAESVTKMRKSGVYVLSKNNSNIGIEQGDKSKKLINYLNTSIKSL